MAQIKTGTANVEQGSATVTFTGVTVVGSALQGYAFNIRGEDAVYSLAADATAPGGVQTIQLTAPYAGTTGAKQFQITTSFSPISGLYEPDISDVDIAILLKHQLVRKIDAGAGMASHLATYNHSLIAHTNRTVLDDLTDNSGVLNYKGEPIGGGASAAHASRHLPGGADPIEYATTSQGGLMASAAVKKLAREYDLVADFGGDKTGAVAINPALETAISTMPARSILRIPRGKYRFTGQIVVNKPLTIIGDGWTTYECYHQRIGDLSPTKLTFDDYSDTDGTVFLVDFAPSAGVYSVLKFTTNSIHLSNIEFFSYQGNPSGNPTWTPTTTPFAVEVTTNGQPRQFSQGCSVENVMLRNLSHGILINGAFQTKLSVIRGQCWDVGIYVNGVYDTQNLSDIRWFPYWADNTVAYAYQFDHFSGLVISRADGVLIDNYFMLRGYTAIRCTGRSSNDLEYPFAYHADDYVAGTDTLDSFRLSNWYFDNTYYAIVADGESVTSGRLLALIGNGFHDEIRTPWTGRGLWIKSNVSGSTVEIANLINWNSKYEQIRIEGTGNTVLLSNAQLATWNAANDGSVALYVGAGNYLHTSNVTMSTSGCNGGAAFGGGGALYGTVTVDGKVGVNYGNPGYHVHFYDNVSTGSVSTRVERQTNSMQSVARYAALTVVNEANDNSPAVNVGVSGADYISRYKGTGTLTELFGQYNSARNESTGTVTLAFGQTADVQNLSTGTIEEAACFRAHRIYSPNSSITNAAGLIIEPIESGTNKKGIYQKGSELNYFGGLIESAVGFKGKGDQLTDLPPQLPDQTGNNGKYLKTNGTVTSWAAVVGGLELSRIVTGDQGAASTDSVVEFTASGTYTLGIGLPDKKVIMVSNTSISGTVTINANAGSYLNGDLYGSYTLPAGCFCILGEDGGGMDAWSIVAVGNNSPSQWVTNGSNIYYSAGKVGIGLASPVTALNIEGGTTATSQIISRFHATGTTGGGAGLLLYHNEPNNGLPGNSTRLGFICLGYFDTDGTTQKNRVLLKAVTTEAHSSSVAGTDFVIETTAAGGTSRTAAVTFKGEKVQLIANCTAAPGSNPTGGGYLYVESGALKYRGSSGTITTIANA